MYTRTRRFVAAVALCEGKRAVPTTSAVPGWTRFPRTRGDRPDRHIRTAALLAVPPHPRG